MEVPVTRTLFAWGHNLFHTVSEARTHCALFWTVLSPAFQAELKGSCPSKGALVEGAVQGKCSRVPEESGGSQLQLRSRVLVTTYGAAMAWSMTVPLGDSD